MSLNSKSIKQIKFRPKIMEKKISVPFHFTEINISPTTAPLQLFLHPPPPFLDEIGPGKGKPEPSNACQSMCMRDYLLCTGATILFFLSATLVSPISRILFPFFFQTLGWQKVLSIHRPYNGLLLVRTLVLNTIAVGKCGSNPTNACRDTCDIL